MWRPSSCKLDFMTVMFVIILNGQLQIIIIYFHYYKKYSNSEIILFPGYSRNIHFTIREKHFGFAFSPHVQYRIETSIYTSQFFYLKTIFFFFYHHGSTQPNSHQFYCRHSSLLCRLIKCSSKNKPLAHRSPSSSPWAARSVHVCVSLR